MKEDTKNSEEKILEGEVVGKIPEKKTHVHREQPAFNIFQIPLLAKLKRNCLMALISFIMFTVAAVYFKNWWFFFLAILLPPWIFSQK